MPRPRLKDMERLAEQEARRTGIKARLDGKRWSQRDEDSVRSELLRRYLKNAQVR